MTTPEAPPRPLSPLEGLPFLPLFNETAALPAPTVIGNDGRLGFGKHAPSGFFESIGNRQVAAGLQSRSVVGKVLRPISQTIAVNAQDFASPVQRTPDGKVPLSDGVSFADSSSLKPEQLLDSVGPAMRSMLTDQLGIDETYLKQFDSFDSAEEAVTWRLQSQRANDRLGDAGAASWTASFALDLVTDPVNVVSLGAGGAVTKGARYAAKALTAVDNTAAVRRILGAAGTANTIKALDSVAKGQNMFLLPSKTALDLLGAKGLASASAAAAGGTLNAVTQVFEMSAYNDIHIDRDYSAIDTGLSAVAAGAFTYGLLSAFGKKAFAHNELVKDWQAARAFGSDIPDVGLNTGPGILASPAEFLPALVAHGTNEEIIRARFPGQYENMPWVRNPEWSTLAAEAGFKGQDPVSWNKFLQNNPSWAEVVAKIGEAGDLGRSHLTKTRDAEIEILKGFEDDIANGVKLRPAEREMFEASQRLVYSIDSHLDGKTTAQIRADALANIPIRKVVSGPAVVHTTIPPTMVPHPDIEKAYSGLAAAIDAETAANAAAKQAADAHASLQGEITRKRFNASKRRVDSTLDASVAASAAKEDAWKAVEAALEQPNVPSGPPTVKTTPVNGQVTTNIPSMAAIIEARKLKAPVPGEMAPSYSGTDTIWSSAWANTHFDRDVLDQVLLSGTPDEIRAARTKYYDSLKSLAAATDGVGRQELSQAVSTFRRLATNDATPEEQAIFFMLLGKSKGSLPNMSQISMGPFRRAMMATPGLKNMDQIGSAGSGRAFAAEYSGPHAELVHIAFNLLDELNQTSVGLSKHEHVVSLFNRKRAELTAWHRTMEPYIKLYEKMPLAERQAADKELSIALTGEPGKYSPLTSSTVAAIRAYYGSVGRRGIRSGAWSNLVDNFVNWRLNEKPALANIDAISEQIHKGFLAQLFKDGNAHRGTLVKLGIAVDKTDGSGLAVGDNAQARLDEIPTKLASLPHDLRVRVVQDMTSPTGALAQDARDSILRHLSMSPVEGERIATSAAGNVRTVTRYGSGDKGRRVLQDILFTKENIEAGLVDTDVIGSGFSYARRSGYTVARQEMMNTLMGQKGFTWEGFLAGLRKLNEDAGLNTREGRLMTRALDMIQQKEEILAGVARSAESAESGFQAGVAGMTGLGLENMVTPSLLVLDISKVWAGFLHATTNGQIHTWIKTLLSNVRTREEMTHIGLGLEAQKMAARQMFEAEFSGGHPIGTITERLAGPWKTALQAAKGETTTRGTAAFENTPALRTVAAGLEAAAQTSRTLTGTEWLNLQVAHGVAGVEYAALATHFPKFSRLLPNIPADASLRGWAGASRASGFTDPHVSRQYHNAGLIEPEMIAALKRMQEIAPDALKSSRKMVAAISQETDPAMRASMLEAMNRVENMVKKQIDTITVQPRAWDIAANPGRRGPYGRLMDQMLTFSRTWYSNYFIQAMDKNAMQSMLMLTTYMVAEATQAALYSVLYGGQSVETATKEWDVSPKRALMHSVLQTPIFGPWTMAARMIADAATGAPGSTPSVGGSAGLNLTSQVFDATKKTFQDGELSDKGNRMISKVIPGWNLVPAQIAKRIAEGWAADDDRKNRRH